MATRSWEPASDRPEWEDPANENHDEDAMDAQTDGIGGSDKLTLSHAVEVLAGRHVPSRDRAYARHRYRIGAAVKRGQLTRHSPLDGQRRPRYSRAEVEALKTAYVLVGIGDRAAPQSRHARVAPAESVLVSSAVARKIVGVARGVPDGWGRRGLYGARKIRGRWFFVRAELPANRRVPGQPPVKVACTRCGDPVMKKASVVRRALARPHGPRFYCEKCWGPDLRDEILVAGRRNAGPLSAEGRTNMGAARRREWRDGVRDRGKQAQTGRDNLGKLHSSPKREIERINNMRQTRGLEPLTADRERTVQANARRRAQASTQRSRQTRELEAKMTELWPTGLTQMELAEQLHVTPGRIAQLVRELELPPRPRGRPRSRNV